MENQRQSQELSGPFELAASWHQEPETLGRGMLEPGRAVALCSQLLEAGLPCKGDQGWKER